MISKDNYEKLLKKFGKVSSWAIWAEQGDKPKSNTGDMSVFENADLLNILNPNYVFVGLNPSTQSFNKAWASFHSTCSYQNDYKLRYALKNTKYWGAYITDIIKSRIDAKSENINKYLKDNPDALNEYVSKLEGEIAILGTSPILIAMGNKAYKILSRTHLKDKYTIVKIKHYSMYIGQDNYRKEVLSVLNNI